MVRKTWLVAMGLVGFLFQNSAPYGAKFDIFNAAAAGKTKEITKKLKKNKELVKKSDERGLTALHYAVRKGHVDTAKVLVQNGANVNAQNENKDTPLHQAISWKEKDTAQYLIREAKASMTIKNKSGLSPFAFSVRQGLLVFIKLFIDNGANVNERYDVIIPMGTEVMRMGSTTVLGKAILTFSAAHGERNQQERKNYLEIIKLLVKNGANVNEGYIDASGSSIRPLRMITNDEELLATPEGKEAVNLLKAHGAHE